MRVELDHAPPSPPEVWDWARHRPAAFYAWAALALAGACVLLALSRRTRARRRVVYMPGKRA
jgi:hypothetical protein